MSLILDREDWQDLLQQTSHFQPNNLILDNFERFWSVPETLGKGFSREVKLSPGVCLNFFDGEYQQDFALKTPVHKHPIQILIVLSGSFHSDIYPTLSKARSYFSGSGISPAFMEEYKTGQHLVCVNVEIEPEVLKSYFLEEELSRAAFEKLYKGEDWKVAFYPTVTSKMRSLARQMWDAPYHGVAKQIYLQGKIFELLALHLDLITTAPQPTKSLPRLKPKSIASLHQAKDILTTQFEHPPSLPELAQQVGVSQRTLQRGFPALFKTTVMGYLRQQRLDRASVLLRENKHSVAEIANLVGYGNIGHFSVAFKRRFSITPSQCLMGEKADFE